MEILKDGFSALPDTVIALGKFDALHKGHMKIIGKMKEISDKKCLKSVIFTFDNISEKFIVSKNDKEKILSSCGIDYMYCQKFNDEFKNTSAEDFFENILIKKFNAKHIVSGDDWHFGKNKSGDVSLLEKMCGEKNIGFSVLKRIEINGETVSSSLIRESVLNGDVKKANLLLGRPLSVEATVASGKRLGSKIGFPTVNFAAEKGRILPKNGVYASKVLYKDDIYLAMTNVGDNPTVDKNIDVRIETHIFDFEKNVYGEKMKIEFLDKIRDEIKFSSVNALVRQLEKDKEYIKNNFKNF